MTKPPFYRMDALGNKFCIFMGSFSDFKNTIDDFSRFFKGDVSFDQLLCLEKLSNRQFYFHITNQDGSSAKQCLNGARCLAWLIDYLDLNQSESFSLSNASGKIPIQSIGQSDAQLILPIPKFNAAEVVDVGNQHCIILCDHIHQVLVDQEGSLKQAAFKEGINVGFVSIKDRNTLYLRTYERGVGETLSCGSSALASAFYGMEKGYLDNSVEVIFKTGSLFIKREDNYFTLRGPVNFSGYA